MDIIAIIVTLISCCISVFLSYNRLSKKIVPECASGDSSGAILEMLKTNNTYPMMLTVLTSLDEDLSECGMELHADMRGYLDNGKAN